ncbi:Myosin regulatory light chain 2 [Folsomia candida]|uniref:Myosin regulatory light chain 2 n=1 Tax=Folsomia candida TaxID=158441 RepID=A0A226DFF0_FOLCA|nr:Myosin regulatory light chain 2 [Folsomia candida]
MADDKKKSKKGDAAASPGGSKKDSKKAEKKVSNVFSAFSQRQIAEFKEAFQMMDHDKDGIIGKGDLKATFDDLGKSVSDSELEALVNDSPAPINFGGLLTLFAARILRKALTTFGMKFTDKDVEDAFSQMNIEGGQIDTQKLIGMLTASGGSED